MFRQALSNPFTCQQFRKFVSIKGENLENDVLFWLEVQKFKVCFMKCDIILISLRRGTKIYERCEADVQEFIMKD